MFTEDIIECRIPKSLEKPINFETYDSIRYIYEYAEHMDIILDYHQDEMQ